MATTEPTFDINDLWKNLSSEQPRQPISNETLMYWQHRSNDPLDKLRKNIKINSAYTVIFLLAWTFLFFYAEHFWLRFLLGIMVAGHIAGLLYNRWLLRDVLITPPADTLIRERLTHLCYRMMQGLKSIEYVALFFYPVSITSGFCLALASENKLDLIGTDPVLQGILVGAMVVLTPACYYLTRWLNKLAFGKEVMRLQALVQSFENE
ncbi:MAG: hypothetical protein C0424_08855 [Sphingobacteriaceae bacterium]|nr:hypothetical protein [Sphingobacteriaceae bacterium]